MDICLILPNRQLKVYYSNHKLQICEVENLGCCKFFALCGVLKLHFALLGIFQRGLYLLGVHAILLPIFYFDLLTTLRNTYCLIPSKSFVLKTLLLFLYDFLFFFFSTLLLNQNR